MAKGKKPKHRIRRFGKAVRRRLAGKKIAILPVTAGVIVPFADSFFKAGVMGKIQAGQPDQAAIAFADQLMQHYTGFKPFNTFEGQGGTWHFEPVIQTYGGLVAGYIGHVLANKFGINKAMNRIPLIGKYFSL